MPAIGMQIEGLRFGDIDDPPEQFLAGHVVDCDQGIIRAGDIKGLAVQTEMHAARPGAGLHGLDDLIVRIEHRDGAGLLVTYED